MGQDGSRNVKQLSTSDESPELGSSHKMKLAAFNKKSDQEIQQISADVPTDYNKSKDWLPKSSNSSTVAQRISYVTHIYIYILYIYMYT